MESSRRPSVLVVDDHPVFRQALTHFLEAGFRVVGEAEEGGQAVAMALEHKPDVVVLDIHMPGMDGIAAAKEIRETLPGTNVVVLSMDDDDEVILAAVEAGISGYVGKNEAAATVFQALELAAQGQAFLPPAIAKRIMSDVAGRRGGVDTHEDGPSLSPREIEVLRLLASGCRNRDMARTLCISERTVTNHVTSIYNKLGIYERTQATAYAIKHGIVRI